MSRNFYFKKDNFESHSGAKKHRFNAEYSGELEANSRKKQKANKRKARPEFVELH
ncbi:hypothetical protein RS130_05845 [Paraglaciecola aquimarina]|uniref:Uncharacterized protein n=1 Tax=Paraglaciecola aquimarina TaxID=1235557 RepID=A0ABU3SU36_9ALTE|nr:hypothetical protein [Paraglaciecola aquimarina]MDU0353513.1 hypothetical protein [Paraglaciecola aquimarina]